MVPREEGVHWRVLKRFLCRREGPGVVNSMVLLFIHVLYGVEASVFVELSTRAGRAGRQAVLSWS